MVTSSDKVNIETFCIKLFLLLICCCRLLSKLDLHSFSYLLCLRRTDLKQLSRLKRAWIWKNARSLSKDLRDSNRFVEWRLIYKHVKTIMKPLSRNWKLMWVWKELSPALLYLCINPFQTCSYLISDSLIMASCGHRNIRTLSY